jgi:hypothetical protein
MKTPRTGARGISQGNYNRLARAGKTNRGGKAQSLQRTNGAVSDKINHNTPGPNRKTLSSRALLLPKTGPERISGVAGRTLGADQKSRTKTNWHRTEAPIERIARGARLRKPEAADTSEKLGRAHKKKLEA